MLRRRAGLSQIEAAVASDVGEKTISSFESGARTIRIRVTQLLALLTAYGVTPAEFFAERLPLRSESDLVRKPARDENDDPDNRSDLPRE